MSWWTVGQVDDAYSSYVLSTFLQSFFFLLLRFSPFSYLQVSGFFLLLAQIYQNLFNEFAFPLMLFRCKGLNFLLGFLCHWYFSFISTWFSLLSPHIFKTVVLKSLSSKFGSRSFSGTVTVFFFFLVVDHTFLFLYMPCGFF